MKKVNAIIVMATVSGLTASAFGAYVTPKMGGGQESAAMVMPNVLFDGTGLSISGIVGHMGHPISETPVLRPLPDGTEFDPAAAWAVLIGKAYNSQYGWNMDADSVSSLPVGADIWIEQTGSTPGLQAYETNTYTPIFGTAGSSAAWRWNGIMAHNIYAVAPGIDDWSASYRLYIGNSVTGEALPGYTEATITLEWTSVPEPASAGLLMLASGSALYARRRA